ncbi:hypothetical protein [Microbacterium sp.]|uniref:hypothetical protein n=1 Tax=Microbacterium sp. TaxID=51671 RepID=UPI00281141FF|nr:hypothetical protein [Microbacterium sp.]
MSRPRTPLEQLEHGTLARYRRGCKCEPCRAANRDRVRDHRARAAAVDTEREQVASIAINIDPDAPVPTIDMQAPAGRVEKAVRKDLKALVGEPPWKRTAAAILRLNARVIDQAPTVDRLDLLSPMQLRAQEWMKLLRSVGPTDGTIAGGAEALLDALGASGDGDH